MTDRYCGGCGALLVRKQQPCGRMEYPNQFLRRRTCDPVCGRALQVKTATEGRRKRPIEGSQQCRDCLQIKPYWTFHRSGNSTTGYTETCKACVVARIEFAEAPVDIQSTRTDPYEATCIACGGHWEGYLTEWWGLRLRVAGARCGWCKGMMEVVPVLVGSIGTISATTPLKSGPRGTWLAKTA